jgi:transposase-like protein
MRSVKLITSVQSAERWSQDEKERIVAESISDNVLYPTLLLREATGGTYGNNRAMTSTTQLHTVG